MMPNPRPARATEGAALTAAATWTGIALGGALAAYIAWINRPGNPNRPDWSVKGPGGFYVGAFVGGAFVPSMDWSFDRSGGQASLPYPVTAENIGLRPSVVGGLKGGYFFHRFPYFGIEGEFSYANFKVREQTVTISPPLVDVGEVPNPVTGSQVRIPSQSLSVMTIALHFIGRYGFFKDEEIPFGRLQPYVGIGPGFVVIYGEVDAAKNFSLEALAGVRYMIQKNLSIFMEYNLSQQWAVELEHQKIQQLFGGFEQRGLATFDFRKHQFVVGICYHFM